MATSLKAEARDGYTKSEVKQLRSKGKVPGVVYGKKIGARTVAVEAKELLALLRSNPHAVVELEVPEAGKFPVMVQQIQRDNMSRDLLHIDFHQINLDEPVHTSVALDFEGEAKGAKEGGLLQIQMHEVEIRCLPNLIPGSIAVDISGLELGDVLLAKDLSLPAGIELKSNPDDVIATLLAPQAGTDESETEGTGEAAAAPEAKAGTAS